MLGKNIEDEKKSLPEAMKKIRHGSLWVLSPQGMLGLVHRGRILLRGQGGAIGSRFARAAAWSMVGTAASRGLGLLCSIILARQLGKEVFGELGIIQSTIGMFGTFAGLGLGVTATKFTAEFRMKDPARAGEILSMAMMLAIVTGLLGALTLCLLSPAIAESSFAAPHLTGALRLATLLVVTGAFSGVQLGALVGLEAFRAVAKLNTMSAGANFLCMTVFGALFGLYGCILGLVLAQALAVVYGHSLFRREVIKCGILVFRSSWFSHLRIIWQFSLPTAFASLVVVPTYWVGQTLVVRHHGYSAIAEYVVGNQWRASVFLLPYLLSSGALPILSSFTSSQKGELRSVMLKSAAALTGLAGLSALITSVFAPALLGLYGADFPAGVLIVRLLLIVAVIDAAALSFTNVIISQGKAWLRLLSNGTWAVIVLLLSFILIPSKGATGLAFALVAGQLAHLTIQASVALRIRQVKP